jgi:hypothetical protein
LDGFSGVGRLQHRYAAGAKVMAIAFAADPKWTNDMKAGFSYNATCYAVLAGAGQGIDADKLDDKERGRLRQQALTWLGDDLANWTKQAASDKPADREEARKTLKHWQIDSDLVVIRDMDAVAKLPAEERGTCEKL